MRLPFRTATCARQRMGRAGRERRFANYMPPYAQESFMRMTLYNNLFRTLYVGFVGISFDRPLAQLLREEANRRFQR